MRHDSEKPEKTEPAAADDVAAETANDGALEDAAVAAEEPLAEEEMNSGERPAIGGTSFHYGF